MAGDYSFPYTQVFGFMAEFCKAGGHVPSKNWAPIGNKDFSSASTRQRSWRWVLWAATTPPARNMMQAPLTTAADRLQGTGAFALDLSNVSRHFGALVAWSGINMRIAAGERRTVLGSNGAGKTTLFNAITVDFPVTTGRISFFGEDVTDLPRKSVSAGVCAAPTRFRNFLADLASATTITWPAGESLVEGFRCYVPERTT